LLKNLQPICLQVIIKIAQKCRFLLGHLLKKESYLFMRYCLVTRVFHKMSRLFWVCLLYIVGLPAFPESQTVMTTGMPVYVTRQDCHQLLAHQPQADVTYRPGMDVHGKPVASADLTPVPGLELLQDRVTFDLKINPLAYSAAGAALERNRPGSFSNTAMPIAKIDVDLLSGRVKVNGQALDGEQARIVSEACRHADTQPVK
jgi:hypothetical protein